MKFGSHEKKVLTSANWHWHAIQEDSHPVNEPVLFFSSGLRRDTFINLWRRSDFDDRPHTDDVFDISIVEGIDIEDKTREKWMKKKIRVSQNKRRLYLNMIFIGIITLEWNIWTLCSRSSEIIKTKHERNSSENLL